MRGGVTLRAFELPPTYSYITAHLGQYAFAFTRLRATWDALVMLWSLSDPVHWMLTHASHGHS
jgi:hypothetical protein